MLQQGIQGISELITVPGLINLDFADVKTIMSEGGAALMGVGFGEGDDKARLAAEQAMNNRLLDISIDGARGILFNVTGGKNMSLFEVNYAASIIKDAAHPDVNLIFGAVIDERMEDQLRITVIATGFDSSIPKRRAVVSTPHKRVRPVGRRPASAASKSKEADSTLDPPDATDPLDLDLPTFLRKR